MVGSCASQRSFSKSFAKRLTLTQHVWHSRFPVDENAAAPVLTPGQRNIHVQDLLDQLVYASPLRGYPVKVKIIDDPKVNAVTDGMTLYLNRGLLELFQHHPDVIASVMAHELGHMLARHHEDRGSRGSSLKALSYLTPALGLLPYGGYYGSLAGTALQQGAHMQNYAYNRMQENEADAIGVFIARRAGYNAMGLGDFLDYAGGNAFGAPCQLPIPLSLQAIPQSAAVMLLSTSPLYRTHPPSSKRKKIVNLMTARSQGTLTQEALRRESRWLADLYEAMELRTPK